MTPCQNCEPITSLHSSVGLRRLLLPTEVLIEVNLLPEPFDEFAPLLLRGSAPPWLGSGSKHAVAEDLALGRSRPLSLCLP